MTLPSDFVSGLVEGEGCFSLNFRSDRKKNRPHSPQYFRWLVLFAIVLKSDDYELLDKVKETLECGTLGYSKGFVRYQVQDNEELLTKIVPFFTLHKLYGKKSKDFKLWKEAVVVIARNKKKAVNLIKGKRGFMKNVWNVNDLKRLKQIRLEMKQYKSKGSDYKWN
jgi:hypothetical protein